MSARGKFYQHWIMLVPMPCDEEFSDYIPEFLSQFQSLYKLAYIQSAYKSGVQGFSKHDGMMNQVEENGNYWKILDNATGKETLSESCQCLSEVLLDSTIREVVSIMFGVTKDDKTWSDDLKAYAFGI